MVLDDWVSTLSINSNVRFSVLCYPDAQGNEQENKKFTEERANAVKAYLISKGIDATKINIKGSTTTDPQNPPPTKKSAKGKRYIGPTYIVVDSL